jgi:alanine racemase
MKNSIFPRMRINLDQIAQNSISICQVAGADISQLVAVVKDNGYGLGSLAVAKTLSSIGVKMFAVATIEEAVYLRLHKIKGEILLLGPIEENFLETAIKNDITLTIIDTTLLGKVAKHNRRRELSLQILLDTGMRRNGLSESDFGDSEVVENLKKIASQVTAVYTHYHSADGDDLTKTDGQDQLFESLLNRLSDFGISSKLTHSANSAGSLRRGIGDRELIRTGISIYGGRPDPQISFSPEISGAVTIEAKIASIRTIKKDEGVSYGHIWSADSDCQIATVAIGYGDGFPRVATGSCKVIINGVKLPVVGRVTMDSIIVKLSNNFDVEVGELVTIIGKNGDEEITVDELAIDSKTISYELFCVFGSLLSREYLNDGVVTEKIGKMVY